MLVLDSFQLLQLFQAFQSAEGHPSAPNTGLSWLSFELTPLHSGSFSGSVEASISSTEGLDPVGAPETPCKPCWLSGVWLKPGPLPAVLT